MSYPRSYVGITAILEVLQRGLATESSMRYDLRPPGPEPQPFRNQQKVQLHVLNQSRRPPLEMHADCGPSPKPRGPSVNPAATVEAAAFVPVLLEISDCSLLGRAALLARSFVDILPRALQGSSFSWLRHDPAGQKRAVLPRQCDFAR